jgi:hypothetical protein
MLSPGWLAGIWSLNSNVSERSVSSIFIGTYEGVTDSVFPNTGT